MRFSTHLGAAYLEFKGDEQPPLPKEFIPFLALLPMGVARLQALLPAPVVSYTTISPLLPKERFVSVARSGRSLRPGRYPASYSKECGLSSPPEGGATTWLTWGFHHNMFEIILEGMEAGIFRQSAVGIINF